MSTHSLDLTLVGWIATPVRHYPGTDGGTPYTSFRLASTRRWFDREQGCGRTAGPSGSPSSASAAPP
ncbi:hypothetical protein [Cellulomonas soli]